MRRLFVLLVAVLLLAGCMQEQTERRYELVIGGGTAWLLDGNTGCVWIVLPDKRAFLPMPVKGLHEGELGKWANGCTTVPNEEAKREAEEFLKGKPKE